ncbi:MAG: citrate synthase/methylcitrate synthase [Planctomycetota bacterium]|nr:citrate synthase/methylcitrate synthase [Planctomycetota bacterium]
MTTAAPGLDGVVAAQTRLSKVDGVAGRLWIAGYPVEEIAPHATFEEMCFLLWHDRRPAAAEAAALRDGLRAAALAAAPGRRGATPMDTLRAGVAALHGDDPETFVGAVPALVAHHRHDRPIAPSTELGHAANTLRMLRGADSTPREARALETNLNTVVDHGMNASTFTARVIASTRSDLASAVTGAIGALKGPLHGGAPGPALAALLALRDEPGDLGANTRAWAARTIDAGERIMGFGHRVYEVRDPRADVLGTAAQEFLAGTGLYEDALTFEQAVLEVLAAKKPGRSIQTNVEFYTALLLHGLGLDAELFSAVFAVGRVAGWIGHVLEQRREGRLLRPRAAYVGPLDRVWT